MRSLAGRVGALVAACCAAVAWLAPQAVAAPVHTTVSLTFDDSDADARQAVPILDRYGVKGTFYVITGAIGTPGYLSREDLRRFAADGQELGGHTVSHLDLTHVSAAEARRQICGSRATLASWGFPTTSFAYPDGTFNPQVESIVKDCGYRSARIVGNLAAPHGCRECEGGEDIPPPDPYAIRTPGEVDTSWTLDDLKSVVLRAQRTGGGWVPVVFHHVCTSGCGQLSVSPAVLDAFVKWLRGRVGQGTTVEPVGAVIGGQPLPVVRPTSAAPHGIANPSLETLAIPPAVNSALETTDDSGAPACWTKADYGKNSVHWRRVRPGHTGAWAEQLTLTSHTSGAAKLLPRFDLGQCAPPVVAGHPYELSAWYRSTVHTQFSVYARDAAGRWRYWTSDPYFASTSDWTQARWRTPPVPQGTTALSFGLTLSDVGSLTTDDYHLTQLARPAPTAASTGLPTQAYVGIGVAVALVILFIWRRPRRDRAGSR